MKVLDNMHEYIKHYDESELKSFLRSYGKKLGNTVVLYALIILTLISDSRVPLKLRVMLTASAGYLLLPADLISDFLPIIGFTDDIAFLTYVMSSANDYITPEVKEEARGKMNRWLKIEHDDAETIDD
ncbi:MAG: YkvA family protein [Bacteroidales bacterium]|nr:YkvA family protein [Bacteroidales bacterium]